MKKLLILFSFFIATQAVCAESNATHRTSLLTNNKVNVWETIVYPNQQQQLKIHRHEYPRVVIALSDGVLKVVNDKGKMHYLKFKKDKAYYLEKDKPGELHTDTNISDHPIKVIVVELK